MMKSTQWAPLLTSHGRSSITQTRQSERGFEHMRSSNQLQASGSLSAALSFKLLPCGSERRQLPAAMPKIIMETTKTSKEFDLVYLQATELLKAFPDFQFKTVTALLVIIGWLVTSEGAQKFIHLNAATTLPATLATFALLVAFKFVWIIGHFRRMRELYAQLTILASEQGVSINCIAGLRLSPLLPATYLVVNILLCVAVVAVVWLICHPATP